MQCREEITHLKEILNSRVDNEWEKQKSSSNAGGDTQLVSWIPEILRTPSEAKEQDADRAMIGAYREKSDVSVYFCIFTSFRIFSPIYCIQIS